MEFSGDRSRSTRFVVPEESMTFWACPWEELEAHAPFPNPAPDQTAESIEETSQTAKKSVWGQGLMWSLITLAYIGTLSIIGYGLYNAIHHWGHHLSQTHAGIGL